MQSWRLVSLRDSCRDGTPACPAGLLLVFLLVGIPLQYARASTVFRWTRGAPGYTLHHSGDGKDRYTIAAGQLEVTLAVDGNELQKVRRRILPVFAVLLSIRYKGVKSLAFTPGDITLELPTRRHALRPLDPDRLSRSLRRAVADRQQQDSADVAQGRSAGEQDRMLRETYQRDALQMQAFLSTNSLRSVMLNTSKNQVSGWIFFRLPRELWRSHQPRADFLLGLPVGNLLLEFPFTLPPNTDPQLRSRPGY
jgi:hypothetical protein